MVKMFIQGGGFMWPILICLVAGIAISIERLISLQLASVNTRKFLGMIKEALVSTGVKGAIERCARTRGPVASIFHAGLIRADRGIEHVEKAITNAGSIEMSMLERGLVWLSTIIAIAPMLGFTGTVYGMVLAFQAIEKANDISPSVVASGISVALLTTLFGLIVAIIIQLAHNFFVSKVDRIVIGMEEGSVELVDYLIEMEESKATAGSK
ncbi:MotA/TolQ/ExbB proton channel family protein [candidate division KSB1 bacterium]|nr:MotA/TolQ/ExbB proton channel family protein [candidate division KSB1 bacterium]